MLVRAPERPVRTHVCDSRHWDGYRPRVGDIVIATAPKVGTTWTQRIVSLLVFQTPEPRPIGPVSPWIDCRFQMPIEAALPMIEAQKHRRFLKSHLPFDALPVYDEVQYIHVARDPRDACMSFLNHFNSFTAEGWGALDEVGLKDPTIGKAVPRPPTTPHEFFRYWLGEGNKAGTPMMSDTFFHTERSYWSERARPNLLMVHYNDLKSDLEGEMRRIAGFLGIDVPETLWPSLVDAATFNTMKRDGGVVLAGMEHAFKEGHQSFLHSGTNERWRDVLTNQDLADYAARLAKETTPGLAHWLAHGRHKAGDPATAPD